MQNSTAELFWCALLEFLSALYLETHISCDVDVLDRSVGPWTPYTVEH